MAFLGYCRFIPPRTSPRRCRARKRGRCFVRPPWQHPGVQQRDSPEAPMTVEEPSMIRGTLAAEIASSRSPVRLFLDEWFPWGLRSVRRRYREAHQFIWLREAGIPHLNCLWSSPRSRVRQPGRAGRPGAVEGEGAVTAAGEGAGASPQLAPAGWRSCGVRRRKGCACRGSARYYSYCNGAATVAGALARLGDDGRSPIRNKKDSPNSERGKVDE